MDQGQPTFEQKQSKRSNLFEYFNGSLEDFNKEVEHLILQFNTVDGELDDKAKILVRIVEVLRTKYIEMRSHIDKVLPVLESDKDYLEDPDTIEDFRISPTRFQETCIQYLGERLIISNQEFLALQDLLVEDISKKIIEIETQLNTYTNAKVELPEKDLRFSYLISPISKKERKELYSKIPKLQKQINVIKTLFKKNIFNQDKGLNTVILSYEKEALLRVLFYRKLKIDRETLNLPNYQYGIALLIVILVLLEGLKVINNQDSQIEVASSLQFLLSLMVSVISAFELKNTYQFYVQKNRISQAFAEQIKSIVGEDKSKNIEIQNTLEDLFEGAIEESGINLDDDGELDLEA